MKSYETLSGNTPLIRIDYRLDGRPGAVYAKLESYNLSGSIKDRVAARIISRAEESGKLAPGQPIVEVTSGDMVYRYCGLAHDTDVKTGDTVKSGSRLGSIGKVNAEASLPTLLHFEVLRGGAYQDPMATLAG